MTNAHFGQALLLAKSDADFSDVSLDQFDGSYLPGFVPVQTTLIAVARLIRWNCFSMFTGELCDFEELEALRYHGRKNYIIIDSPKDEGRLFRLVKGKLTAVGEATDTKTNDFRTPAAKAL